ncbi:MAG: HAD-IIIC family phosphatase [Colwellia sp.]|jgi:HAD-superfamily phosphatase, subfamily IIIC/FkbH-like domain
MSQELDLITEYQSDKYSAFKASKVVSYFAKNKAETAFPLLNVSLLGTVTLDFLAMPLNAAGNINGININARCAPSEQVMQQALDPNSELYRTKPDIILVLARLEDLFPPLIDPLVKKTSEFLEDAKNEILGQIEQWLTSIRMQTNSVIVLHTFATPDWSVDVVNEAVNTNSLWRFTQDLNLSLADIVDNHTGTFLVNIDRVINATPDNGWFDAKLWYLGRIAFGSKDPRALINSWMPILRQAVGSRKKCLVVDLDNTLWGGVIGEDGMQGIKIGSDFPGSVYRDVQKQILDLWQCGVMLAIASKNNEADAKEVFDKHPEMVLKWDHFLVKKVNWSDKASNLSEISRELNIGLDHMVFMDDNPVECGLVAQELPKVTVLQVPVDNIVRYPQLLSENRLFDGSRLTEEDRNRNQMYSGNSQREIAKRKSTNIGEFLGSLTMSAQFSPINNLSNARSYQMLTKTNQFNLTTIRYSEAEVIKIANDSQWLTLTASLTDKFGDNGQVGLMFVKLLGDEAVIDTFLMSCRVIGRTLETAIISEVADKLRKLGIVSLKARYFPTHKNELVKDLYENHGFDLIEEYIDGRKFYGMGLTQDNKLPSHFITINQGY